MAASDAWPFPPQGALQRHYFAMRSTTGGLITGWTSPDSEISRDGGAFVDCTNEAIEIGTSGVGYIELTSIETALNHCVIYKLTVTNANAVPLVMPLYLHNTAKWYAGADAVWDENTGPHSIAHTFGKTVDLIRKSNTATETFVLDGEPVSALVVPISLDQPTGTFDSQVALFVSGDLAGVCCPIDRYVRIAHNNSRLYFQEPLPATPVVDDEIVVLPSHIHSLIQTAQSVRALGVGVRATQADDGTIVLYRGRTYDDIGHDRINFSVVKDYSGFTFQFKIWNPETMGTYQTSTATVISSALIKVDAFTAGVGGVFSFTGDPPIFSARYSLTATIGDSIETIATGPLYCYDQP